jgi:hypothetical protein
MTTTESSTFDSLQAALKSGGVESAFDNLAEHLRGEQKFHEMFDVRLMQARRKVGLPVITSQGLDDLAEPLRTRMEEAYLAACREIGGLLLAAGRLREAWMYLRPLGDKPLVAAALEKLPSEGHYEEIIEIALHEGVAPALGFRLVLAHYGICNAISLFDAEMPQKPRHERQQVAALLVEHLHRDLMSSLKAEITREQGIAPQEPTIAGLVADREWLFANDNYHVDTTHLSSVVRFALVIDDAEALRKALDLTEYGRRLNVSYQFRGEEPFADTYPTTALFLGALLGQNVEEALAFFQERATTLSCDTAGTAPAEVYIGLLSRLKRNSEALDAAASLLPPGVRTSGFAPSLLELAALAGRYDRLMDVCRERGDLVGYMAGLAADAGK